MQLNAIIVWLFLAASLYGQIVVQPFEATIAKAVKVEPLADSVAIIAEQPQPGTKTGAYLQITSSAKWATPLLDGVNITQTKTPGEWILFAAPGRYRILLAEFDPETGPKYSFHDLVIGKPTTPDPKPMHLTPIWSRLKTSYAVPR